MRAHQAVKFPHEREQFTVGRSLVYIAVRLRRIQYALEATETRIFFESLPLTEYYIFGFSGERDPQSLDIVGQMLLFVICHSA
jgi:hypothetical protein